VSLWLDHRWSKSGRISLRKVIELLRMARLASFIAAIPILSPHAYGQSGVVWRGAKWGIAKAQVAKLFPDAHEFVDYVGC